MDNLLHQGPALLLRRQQAAKVTELKTFLSSCDVLTKRLREYQDLQNALVEQPVRMDRLDELSSRLLNALQSPTDTYSRNVNDVIDADEKCVKPYQLGRPCTKKATGFQQRCLSAGEKVSLRLQDGTSCTVIVPKKYPIGEPYCNCKPFPIWRNNPCSHVRDFIEERDSKCWLKRNPVETLLPLSFEEAKRYQIVTMNAPYTVPGGKWMLKQGKDGRHYCTCPDWTNRRNRNVVKQPKDDDHRYTAAACCKHMKAFLDGCQHLASHVTVNAYTGDVTNRRAKYSTSSNRLCMSNQSNKRKRTSHVETSQKRKKALSDVKLPMKAAEGVVSRDHFSQYVGYFASIKLDGHNAMYDYASGKVYSRQGHELSLHTDILKELKMLSHNLRMSLVFEVWAGLGMKAFQSIPSLLSDPSSQKRSLRCCIFDIMSDTLTFRQRQFLLRNAFTMLSTTPDKPVYIHRVGQTIVESADHLAQMYDAALQKGHEGMIVMDPLSTYVYHRRSNGYRRIKPIKDAEGSYTGNQRTNAAGDVTSIELETTLPGYNMVRFYLTLNNRPVPVVGAKITFTYLDVYQSGKPRSASWFRVDASKQHEQRKHKHEGPPSVRKEFGTPMKPRNRGRLGGPRLYL